MLVPPKRLSQAALRRRGLLAVLLRDHVRAPIHLDEPELPREPEATQRYLRRCSRPGFDRWPGPSSRAARLRPSRAPGADTSLASLLNISVPACARRHVRLRLGRPAAVRSQDDGRNLEGAAQPGERSKWGELVAPRVYAPIHQHFCNTRLDMMVDGPNNSVYEVNSVADPSGGLTTRTTTHFHTEATLLETESQAQRIINPLSERFWTIANPSSINRLGNPVSYKLMPWENVLPFVGEGARVARTRQVPTGSAGCR
jgi:hypothetical protein